MKYVFFSIFILIACSLSAQDTKPVTWSVEGTDLQKNKGKINITAKLSEGWVIYGLNNDSPTPIATKIKIENATALNDMTSSPLPVKKYDAIMEQEMLKHSTQTTFSQKIKFDNQNNIKIAITYMACNNVSCLPPSTEHFDVKFK